MTGRSAVVESWGRIWDEKAGKIYQNKENNAKKNVEKKKFWPGGGGTKKKKKNLRKLKKI